MRSEFPLYRQMWRTLSTIFLLVLVIGFSSCGSSAPTTKRDNFAYVYGKGSGAVQLQVRVHNSTSDGTAIYYKLNTRDLLYKSDGGGGPFTAVVRITYESYTDWGSKTLLDSASTLIQDKSSDTGEDKELIGKMDMRRKDDRSFVVKVTARDLNRESQSSVFVRVERDPLGTRQYFLPMDPETSLPLFDDHLTTGRTVKLKCPMHGGLMLYGSHHNIDASLPSPVFTGNSSQRPEQRADSTFTLEVNNEGFVLLDLKRPGVYHMTTDTASGTGYSLFVLSETYPYVGRGTDMLKPLRYITSLQEYDRISTSENVRQSIERFWLDAAGDRERAREAIRIYYSRVENANRHFTSHVEGWRTDRGLVHIIFGTPNSIYKSDLSETWIYGEENNLMSLTFTFTQRSGQFTDNDLVLERDPMLKGAWYRNVESWRNGRVYQN